MVVVGRRAAAAGGAAGSQRSYTAAQQASIVAAAMPGRRGMRAQTPSVAAGGTQAQAIAKKNRRGRATGSGPSKASTSPATPAVAQRRWDRRRSCGCGTVAAMADVTEYWGRFQASDEQVMAGLRRVVASAEGGSEHQSTGGLARAAGGRGRGPLCHASAQAHYTTGTGEVRGVGRWHHDG
eukprot:COSAG01_NODE_9088_length_2560_cov_11.086144_2_plen_181_part_00